MSPRADRAEIGRALGLLIEPGKVAEVRVPNANGGGTVAGYFDDPGKLARAAAQWSGQAPGVYVTLNPVQGSLLARARNRTISHAKAAAGDADVTARRWLPLD